jgi:hypothetical protein
MRALQMPELTEEQLAELSKTYRNTKDVRIRTRVQMVLTSRGAIPDSTAYCHHSP